MARRYVGNQIDPSQQGSRPSATSGAWTPWALLSTLITMAILSVFAVIGFLAVLLVCSPFIMAFLGGIYCAHTTAYIAGCP